jgi:F1F0 ATPase subunit 2
MITTDNILLSSITGITLGFLFFGGLWLTVKMAVSSPYAAFWVLASSLLRMGIVLTGLYFIAGGSWQRLLIAVLGFIAARFAVMWLTRHYDHKQLRLSKADPS